MRAQLSGSLVAAGALMLWVSAAPVSGQGQMAKTAAGCPALPAQFHPCAIAKAKTFNPPRTVEGRPDMQGLWSRTVTSQDIEEHGDGYGRQAGPSIIIDPAEGKIPYQPWALELRKDMAEKYISPLADCYPSGVPRQVYAPGGSRIVQTPGYLAFLLESSHSYRIIPTAAGPHVGNNLKLWMGDSRGRWEGNTLVVDVTNSNGMTWFDNAGNFYSDALHVAERFTLVDADTIHYEARIEDPKVYTRPWTIAFALTRNKEPGFELLEEACHEGNRSRESSLSIGMKRYTGVVPPRD